MQVRFWGVRGSIPCPGPQTVRYGGNTTCIEVRGDDGTLVILDAGTGIFPFAQALLKELPVMPHIFVTHTHWDHIQGLPFFTPFYIPGNRVHLYGPFDVVAQRGIERVMDVQMQYSYFPIREAELRAQLDYTTVQPNVVVEVGSLKITPLLLNHPVANLGYRIDGDGSALFFTGDHEPWRNIYEPHDEGYADFARMVEEQERQLDEALRGVELLIADCAYTRAEYPAKVGWGHGTLEGALAWAKGLQVSTLVCTHHEPTRSDDALDTVFAAALEQCGYAPGEGGAPAVHLGREGLVLSVRGRESALSSSVD
ncbi:MAG: MBL fold metallo-hydrolase [Myxococcota bacterium]